MEKTTIAGRDVVSLDTFSPEEIRWLVGRARSMKADGYGLPLQGRALAMVFFNPSLRTRASFAIAFSSLGGTVIDLTAERDIWNLELRDGATMAGPAEEHVKDAAAVLSEYADAIAIRSLARHDDWAMERRDLVLVSFQKHSTVPLFNMESVLEHPCQAWGDALTLEEEFGDLRGRKIALSWVYSPNARPLAVPHAVAILASKTGMNLTICHPEGYELDPGILDVVQRNSAETGGSVRTTSDLRDAVAGTHVVYAASWGSTNLHGRPDEERLLRSRHTDRRITADLMSRSQAGRFMHAMPIRRNVEADDAVVDSQNSLVIRQAGNRLHIQRALFAEVLAQ
jgi:N-acetylornithine carbamoyltransferase